MKNPVMSRLVCLLLAVLTVLTLCSCASSPSTDHPETASNGTELSVYFFSAGKADAILLTTKNATVLIDCGEKGFGQTILDHLSEQGISKIDVLIITHFDQDHVGGAAKVINNIPIETVLQSNCPKDSEEYEKYVKALNNAGLVPTTVREDYAFILDGVMFDINPPRLSDYQDDDSNNSSLIVTVTNGDNVLLFMGDAQTERIAEYLAGAPVDCDLIKIPHHGGADEMMDELIAATEPEYAVITCAEEEPDISFTYAMLAEANVSILLTSEAPVTVHSDGTILTVGYTE